LTSTDKRQCLRLFVKRELRGVHGYLVSYPARNDETHCRATPLPATLDAKAGDVREEQHLISLTTGHSFVHNVALNHLAV
jgi:hypothetical protein